MAYNDVTILKKNTKSTEIKKNATYLADVNKTKRLMKLFWKFLKYYTSTHQHKHSVTLSVCSQL